MTSPHHRKSGRLSRSSFQASILKPTSPNHALQRTAPRVTVAAISSSDPSRPVVALFNVRCLSLRSTFAATAPRSAVAELGVVRPLHTL